MEMAVRNSLGDVTRFSPAFPPFLATVIIGIDAEGGIRTQIYP